MGKVLYQSKGAPVGLVALKVILSLVFAGIGVPMAIFYAKQNETYQYFGVSNSQFTTMMWVGIIFIILGVAILVETIMTNGQSITIYDNHVEGVFCKGGLIGAVQKVRFNLMYNQINNVQIVKKGAFDYLEISAAGKIYKVPVKGNINEAVYAIQSHLNR